MAGAGVKSSRQGRNVITGRKKDESIDFRRDVQVDNFDSGKASVVQLQRQLKALKEENSTLKKDLDDVRGMYDQLVSEGPQEQYGERRVHLLKSYVIQLERQVLMQAEALSSRSGVLFEVENNLQSLADDLRELLSSEIKSPSVPVQRSQLTTMIEAAESARLRLYKNLESTSQEKLELPLIVMGNFTKLKPHRHDDRPVSVMDVCSGRTDHLNLKHVAKLESKLFTLHQQLHTLHQSLKTSWSPDQHNTHLPANQHLPSAVHERLSSLLSRSDKLLVECCQDLMTLTILIPAAPWPLLTKSVALEINVDDVVAALPNFPRSKQSQVKSVVDAVIKASNYSRRVSKMEAKACVEELRFHQALYEIQLKYMESLYAAVREAYVLFESSIQDTLCRPVKEVLTCFEKLKETASEDALRDFLSAFKMHREQLEGTVEGLMETQGGGAEAISAHGDRFLATVKGAVMKAGAERDRLAGELEEVKRVREEHLREGLQVLKTPSIQKGEEGEGEGGDASTQERGENHTGEKGNS